MQVNELTNCSSYMANPTMKREATSSTQPAHSPDESIEKSETNQWGQLIPELLEKVIEKLDFETDRRSILNMRGVHPHWNEVVNGVLERRRLPVLCKWDPYFETGWAVDIFQRKYCPLFIPRVELAPFNPSVVGIGPEVGAGFINSIYLCQKAEERMTRTKKAKLDQLSSALAGVSFIQNLTSVILHGIQHSPRQLQQFLNAAPQLKTLEILHTTVMLKECQDFEEEWPLPSLPQLTMLIAKGNKTDVNKRGVKYQVARWLTTPYTQLRHLEVDNGRLVDPWKLDLLEQLKIWGIASLPSGKPVAASASLLRLSILEPERNQLALKDLVSFIQQFAGKLAHLHLDLRMENFKDVEPEQYIRRKVVRSGLPDLFLENQVMFPKLKVFALRQHEVRRGWAAVKYLLQQFPALEELQFIAKDQPKYLYLPTEIWELCPNIKSRPKYAKSDEKSLWLRKPSNGYFFSTDDFSDTSSEDDVSDNFFDETSEDDV